MISYLQGTLSEKSPTEIVIDVHGVAYAVSIPLSTFEKLPARGNTVKVLTYLHVRDDAMQLYGFATEAEREMFKLLISISGIGPKMAQGILSGCSVNELKGFILNGNFAALTAIPRIGRRTADRLIVELRDKIGKLEFATETALPPQQAEIRSEALLALTSLGYTRLAAEKALRLALQSTDGANLTVEKLIKEALKHVTK